MDREDYDVLRELGETLAHLEQAQEKPGQCVNSSSIGRRIAEFAQACERGELRGRNRKRRADALLCELLRALGRLT